MIIVQISREFDSDTGVGRVVSSLERELSALGHEVRRFGPKEAGIPFAGRRLTSSGIRRHLGHAAQIVAFSTIGTVRARRTARELPPEAVMLCHNDVLAGEVYVNHGLLEVAMRARGHFWLRMVRNPVHLFTAARDRIRYQTRLHQTVVSLTDVDDAALRATYPRLKPDAVVIGNGVDIARFRPPTPAEREAAREDLGLSSGDCVTVFIGNEFDRKGLFPLVDAVERAGRKHHLIVVGGSVDMQDRLRGAAERHGVSDRCHPVGPQDPLPYLWAADLLAQPSAYESYGLVVTEAMAAGLPVLSTPVGCAPELIEPGINGFLTDGSVDDLTRLLQEIGSRDLSPMRISARTTAEGQTWTAIAHRYVALLARTQGRRGREAV